MGKNNIPSESPIYKTLEKVAKTARVVVFSGLPGVGKSLYINQFHTIAQKLGRSVTLIQWDIARKAFETPDILNHFPMENGTVHNGVKLCAGIWLMSTLKTWLEKHSHKPCLLLIEAPLVGHRFIELAQKQTDRALEHFLTGEEVQFIVPIPSKKVRKKIEADRRIQVSDNAHTWMGAKPSVITMIWNDLYAVACALGYPLPKRENAPYDPTIYEFVFRSVLKHRHLIPLHIDEIFPTYIKSEEELHCINSLKADNDTAAKYVKDIIEHYAHDAEIDKTTAFWYRT